MAVSGSVAADLLSRVDTAAGHVDVEQGHVRPVLQSQPDRVVGGRPLRADLAPARFQGLADPCAQSCVVVCHDHSDMTVCHHATVTTLPLPCSASMLNVPGSACARSRMVVNP